MTPELFLMQSLNKLDKAALSENFWFRTERRRENWDWWTVLRVSSCESKWQWMIWASKTLFIIKQLDIWINFQLNVESEVIRRCFSFTKLCSMIGPENSRNPLDQSNLKLNSTATWSFVFSRASSSFLVFTLSSHWLASDKVNLFSDWTLGLLWYWFSTLNGKFLLSPDGVASRGNLIPPNGVLVCHVAFPSHLVKNPRIWGPLFGINPAVFQLELCYWKPSLWLSQNSGSTEVLCCVGSDILHNETFWSPWLVVEYWTIIRSILNTCLSASFVICQHQRTRCSSNLNRSFLQNVRKIPQ